MPGRMELSEACWRATEHEPTYQEPSRQDSLQKKSWGLQGSLGVSQAGKQRRLPTGTSLPLEAAWGGWR